MATGQAAGAAAVQALDENGKIQKISISRLQKKLVEAGMNPPYWTTT